MFVRRTVFFAVRADAVQPVYRAAEFRLCKRIILRIDREQLVRAAREMLFKRIGRKPAQARRPAIKMKPVRRIVDLCAGLSVFFCRKSSEHAADGRIAMHHVIAILPQDGFELFVSPQIAPAERRARERYVEHGVRIDQFQSVLLVEIVPRGNMDLPAALLQQLHQRFMKLPDMALYRCNQKYSFHPISFRFLRITPFRHSRFPSPAKLLCGVMMTFSRVQSGLLSGSGSGSNTSRTAPPMLSIRSSSAF